MKALFYVVLVAGIGNAWMCDDGFGGAVLTIDYTQTWAQEITKGRGLIAVGLVIVARWKPLLVLPICLLFGLAEVATLRIQAAGIEEQAAPKRFVRVKKRIEVAEGAPRGQASLF